MKEEEIEVLDEIKGVKVVEHERQYDTKSGNDKENVWDYYKLADGRLCVYRNGSFWEWQ